MTYTEITERKRAELDAQAARAELAHMARVATLGELASSFAHQLNQPLTAIVADAQPAAGRSPGATATARSRRCSRTSPPTASGRGRSSCGCARCCGRTTRGPCRSTSGPRRDVAALVANDALIREVSLRLSLPPRPLTVHGDRIQLQQAGSTPDERAGGVRRRRGGAARRSRCPRHGRTGVMIEVKDTGPGLPSRRRASSTPSTRPSRPAWAWACRSSGRSWKPTAARPTPSTARTEAPWSASASRWPRVSGHDRPPMVFVVDDDHSVRRSLARLLSATGYRAESFGSAADSWSACSCDGPACALIDVRMPDVSGFDLFQQLQVRCPAAGRLHHRTRRPGHGGSGDPAGAAASWSSRSTSGAAGAWWNRRLKRHECA